jgi:hypothetical protein
MVGLSWHKRMRECSILVSRRRHYNDCMSWRTSELLSGGSQFVNETRGCCDVRRATWDVIHTVGVLIPPALWAGTAQARHPDQTLGVIYADAFPTLAPLGLSVFALKRGLLANGRFYPILQHGQYGNA